MIKSIKKLVDSVENTNKITENLEQISESLLTMSKGIEDNGLEITILIKPRSNEMTTITENDNQSTSTDERSEKARFGFDKDSSKSINIDRDDEDLMEILKSEMIIKREQIKLDYRKNKTTENGQRVINVLLDEVAEIKETLSPIEEFQYNERIITKLWGNCNHPSWKFWATRDEKLTEHQWNAIWFFQSGNVAIPINMQGKIIHIMKVHKETYSEWFVRSLAFKIGILPGDEFITQPVRQLLIKIGVISIATGGVVILLNAYGQQWMKPYIERVFSLHPGTLGS